MAVVWCVISIFAKQIGIFMKRYNYLIVGAGLYGSMMAYKLTKQGRQCLVIDKRGHLGGNIYCENIYGINVHEYGAHIFHTSNRVVWDFVNSIVPFNRYTNSPLARYKDKLYTYKYGILDYLCLRFEHDEYDAPNYQGNAVVNYTSADVPYTRTIEHKHFEMFGDKVYDIPKTVVSKEYPQEWREGLEPYYPVNDAKNMELYARYKALADKEEDVVFGGRLAEYKYYDMTPIVERVLNIKV